MRSFPKVKVIDYGNLTPLQRLTIASNVRKNALFINDFIDNNNFIDIILNAMQKINSMKFANLEGYDVLISYAGILKKFARYNLLENDQIIKLCMFVEALILNTKNYTFRNPNKDETFNLEKRKKEFELIIKITKSLLFFAIGYNDNMVLKNTLMTNGKIFETLNFYFSKNEVGKYVSKNCIDILNYIRKDIFEKNNTDDTISKPSSKKVDHNNAKKENKVGFMPKNKILIERDEFEDEEEREQKILKQLKEQERKDEEVDNIVDDFFMKKKEKTLADFFKKGEIRQTNDELIRITNEIRIKLVEYSSILISLSMGGDDYYIYGLRRCINNNVDLNINIIKNINLRHVEKDFIIFLDQKTEIMESLYENFFKFDTTLKEVTDEISEIIDDFFLKINCKSANFLSKDNEENFIKDKQTRIFTNTKTIRENEIPFNKCRFLLNKSNFIYSILKIVNFSKGKEDINGFLLNKVIQLISFYCEDHPDNIVLTFSQEILFALCNFPPDYAEKIFDLFISCLKILIKNDFEMTYSVNFIKTVTMYFLNIRVINNLVIYYYL